MFSDALYNIDLGLKKICCACPHFLNFWFIWESLFQGGGSSSEQVILDIRTQVG